MQHWNIPPRNFCLTSEEVHVWRANLDLSVTEVEELTKILSTDEREKANKFRFEEHRRRSIVTRGRLRQILANYLNISAEEILFEYSDRGKPNLSQHLDRDNLQFNVSHSQNLALYAFTYQNRVGIDLEYFRSTNDAVQIARRFFAPQEYELISSLEKDRQREVFLHIWTIKEAYLKATGEGLSGSLDAVQVSFQGEQPVGLAAVDGNSPQAANWLVHSFVPERKFIATVAVESRFNSGQHQQIRFWTTKQT
ncbi:MAG: 4'-phosphopantetheinyl transferase superfamily protein [Xenococcaceae cyanobacterium MO_188.B32]|nr:4'-phosphopantetheinyl transferase superfamily protein [Xenococcaceae cyanobacterium MO_188.B32]